MGWQVDDNKAVLVDVEWATTKGVEGVLVEGAGDVLQCNEMGVTRSFGRSIMKGGKWECFWVGTMRCWGFKRKRGKGSVPTGCT